MPIARQKQFETQANRSRGFTLLELLVVIGVMIALVSTTLPAFRAIQESNRKSGGFNALSAMLSTARSIAIRDNRDTAVMFMYDIPRGICSMQMLVQESTVVEADPSSGMDAATVWVPVEGSAPMELPQGAVVYGYGYGASRQGDANPNNAHTWYCDLGLLYKDSPYKRYDPWLIPRTDYRVYANDPDADPIERDVEKLDTFIVRFSANGTVVTNAEELGSGAKGGDGFLELDDPGTVDYRQWSPRVVDEDGVKIAIAEYQLRSVPLLVVIDLAELSEATGIKEPWRIQGEGASIERRDSNGNRKDDQIEVDLWIRDNTSVVAFNRYTGRIMRDIRR